MRDAIRDFEKQALVDALRAGKTWEQAKELLPDVDPKVLDEGFKAWAHADAGLELVEEPLPDGVEGVTADELHAAVDAHLEAGGTVALETAAPELAAAEAPAKKGGKGRKKHQPEE